MIEEGNRLQQLEKRLQQVEMLTDEYLTDEEITTRVSAILSNYSGNIRISSGGIMDTKGRWKLSGDGSAVAGDNDLTEPMTVEDIINDRIDTQSAQILADWTFGAFGAFNISTDANNGLWISPTGILAKKGGSNTLAITNDGEATFTGTVAAGAIISADIAAERITTGTLNADRINVGEINIGDLNNAGALAEKSTVGETDLDTTVISDGKIITGLLTASNITTGTLNASQVTVSNLDASNINTGTLTGRTIQTSDEGEAVVLDSAYDDLAFYDSNDKLQGIVDCTTDYFRLVSNQSGKSMYFAQRDSGGTLRLALNLYGDKVVVAQHLKPFSTSLDIGGSASSDQWRDIHLSRNADIGGDLEVSGGFLLGSATIGTDGAMYYSSSLNKIRVRINGTWLSLATE